MGSLKFFVWKITPKFLIDFYHSIKKAFYGDNFTKKVFTQKRRENAWGSSESLSGPGSELEKTKTLIMELPKLFNSKGIKSILDIPCGDFNWMKNVDLSAVDYIGADIVDELTLENLKNYSSEGRKFLTLDLITDKLPKVDLIFVRDCFVHLSYKDIMNAINNIKRSGCKYLFTTTFVDYRDNHDIITGDWRPINLQDAPFNFPAPEYTLIEDPQSSEEFRDKAMGLWLIEKL